MSTHARAPIATCGVSATRSRTGSQGTSPGSSPSPTRSARVTHTDSTTSIVRPAATRPTTVRADIHCPRSPMPTPLGLMATKARAAALMCTSRIRASPREPAAPARRPTGITDARPTSMNRCGGSSTAAGSRTAFTPLIERTRPTRSSPTGTRTVSTSHDATSSAPASRRACESTGHGDARPWTQSTTEPRTTAASASSRMALRGSGAAEACPFGHRPRPVTARRTPCHRHPLPRPLTR